MTPICVDIDLRVNICITQLEKMPSVYGVAAKICAVSPETWMGFFGQSSHIKYISVLQVLEAFLS